MEVLVDNKKQIKRDYRNATIMFLIDVTALMLLRIFASYMSDWLPAGMDDDTVDLIIDAVFTVVIQLLVMFGGTLLFHMIAGKKSAGRVFKESYFRAPRWWMIVFPIIMGSVVLFVTMGFSMFWQIIIISLGYIPIGGEPMLQYPVWLLLVNLVLTAVLPGFCEEFMFRGINLRSTKERFGFWPAIIITAVMFGIGHVFILQTYFTFLMGILCAYLVLKFKNILPAIIIHTMNNGISVLSEFLEVRKIFGYQIFDYINNALGSIADLNFVPMLVCVFVWTLCLGVLIGMVFLMKFFHKRELARAEAAKSSEDILFDGIVNAGQNQTEQTAPIEAPAASQAASAVPAKKHKLNLAENAFLIGAAIIGIIGTIVGFMSGLL